MVHNNEKCNLSHVARRSLRCTKYSIKRRYGSEGSADCPHCDHLPAYNFYPAWYLSAKKGLY